jgi:hypothetical protein
MVDDRLEIRSYPPENTRSLRGVLKKYATRVLSTDELREARERAWAEAVTADWNQGLLGPTEPA